MPTTLRTFRRGIALAGAMLLAACSSSDPSTPASITLASSASTLSIAQGATSTATVTLARTNFTGDVQLVAEGAPGGVTATFAPAALSGAVAQSTVTIAVGAAAAPGSATITLRAKGTGVTDATTAVALTIPQPAAQSYTLALASGTLSLAPAGTGTVNLALTRTNFTGAVAFSTTGLPTGATAVFAPASTTTSASVLTVSAGTAAPGTYTVTVTGAATGLADRTATLTLTITAAPSFTMTLASGTASIAQGASATVNVTLVRTNFTSAVAFAATGAPTGATVTFAPSPTTADATVMTISTGTAVAGASTITVTGSATGLTDRTATLALTVTAPAGYTLAPALPTVAVTAGATATVNIALTRTNFASDVALAVTGLPAGATASFAPNPASGTTSTLTIVTGSAVAGSYALTITGTAAPLANRTAPLTLSITAVAGTNVQFAFCPDALPTWVGYQDGTGAWKQASAGANNTYAFSIAGKGGVAIVRPMDGVSATSGFDTEIYYASAAELLSIGASNCAVPALGTKTVNGSVAGAASGFATIVLGNAQASAFTDGPFTLDSVQNGPHDLLASLTSLTTIQVSNLIMRRGLDPASGSTLPVLDFSSAESIALSPSALSLPGVAAAADVFTGSTFMTANGSAISVGFGQSTGADATYTGVPGTISGDLQELLVDATEASGTRGALAYFVGTGARSFTMGPVLSTATLTSLGATPYARLRAQWASQATYNSMAVADFSQSGATLSSTDRSVQIMATPAYFGGVPATWDLSIPDFSAATGFNNSWMLATGVVTDVTIASYGGNILTAVPAAGTTFYFAQNDGVTTTTASASAARMQRLSPTRRSATKLTAKNAAKIMAKNAHTLRLMHNRRTLRMMGRR